MKNKLACVFSFALLLTLTNCKEKKSNEIIEDDLNSSSIIEKSTAPTESSKSLTFEIDGANYYLDTSNPTINDVLQSKTEFTFFIQAIEENNTDNQVTLEFRLSGTELKAGKQNLIASILIFNSPKDNYPQTLSSVDTLNSFEIVSLKKLKEEEGAGIKITDYLISGNFSGNFEGVNEKGVVQKINLKNGIFKNFIYSEIK